MVKNRHDGDICVSDSTEPEPEDHGPAHQMVNIDQPYQEPRKEQKQRDVDERGH